MAANRIKEIKELAKLLNEAGLTAIEVSEGESRIRLEKNCAAPAAVPAVKPVPVHEVPKQAEPQAEPGGLDFNNLTEVKAPMIGVFYRAPAEGSEPFVKVGGKVKKGDTLCIIEAMKMMNEITAETDGEIVDICVENGEVVEYSQVLFKIF